MADPKDIMDVLNLIVDVGNTATAIRAGGNSGLWSDLQALSALWAPVKTIIGDVPTAAVDVPAELGNLSLQDVEDIVAKFGEVYTAWSNFLRATPPPAAA